MAKNQKPQPQDETVFKLTLEGLKAKFPDKTMLNIQETAKAYGFLKSDGNPNPQTIYNAMRKGAPHPFPVHPKKRCGKLYWNIVQIAADQAS